jgi:hypothetical protein
LIQTTRSVMDLLMTRRPLCRPSLPPDIVADLGLDAGMCSLNLSLLWSSKLDFFDTSALSLEYNVCVWMPQLDLYTAMLQVKVWLQR